MVFQICMEATQFEPGLGLKEKDPGGMLANQHFSPKRTLTYLGFLGVQLLEYGFVIAPKDIANFPFHGWKLSRYKIVLSCIVVVLWCMLVALRCMLYMLLTWLQSTT